MQNFTNIFRAIFKKTAVFFCKMRTIFFGRKIENRNHQITTKLGFWPTPAKSASENIENPRSLLVIQVKFTFVKTRTEIWAFSVLVYFNGFFTDKSTFYKLWTFPSDILDESYACLRGSNWFLFGKMIFEILVGRNTPSIGELLPKFLDLCAKWAMCHAHVQIWS